MFQLSGIRYSYSSLSFPDRSLSTAPAFRIRFEVRGLDFSFGRLSLTETPIPLNIVGSVIIFKEYSLIMGLQFCRALLDKAKPNDNSDCSTSDKFRSRKFTVLWLAT